MPTSQILVIDDEPALRQILVTVLTRAGYFVDEAGNFHEAKARLARLEKKTEKARERQAAQILLIARTKKEAQQRVREQIAPGRLLRRRVHAAFGADVNLITSCPLTYRRL